MSAKKIFVYPFNSGFNDYIDLHKSIWLNHGFSCHSIKNLIISIHNRKNNIVVINWFEDRIKKGGIGGAFELLFCLLLLIFFKISSKKLIWVKHNYRPHKHSHKSIILYEVLCNWLDKFCTHKLSHSNKYAEYVPHPLYSKEYVNSNIEYSYVFFGSISRYKGITELLKLWPAYEKLYLFGRSNDQFLTEEIKNIIKSRKLDIFWKNQYISNEELGSVLRKTETVVLPHRPNEMIVTGAFFHAISFGANILSYDTEFSREFSMKHKFITKYKNELENAVANQKIVSRKEVFKDAIKNYSDEKVWEYWKKYLH